MSLLVGTSRRVGCVSTRRRSNLSRWWQTLFHQNLSNATQRSVLWWVEMFIKITRLLVLFPAFHSDCYYDYKLSLVRRRFGDQILTFNCCCCPSKLALFPMATWMLLMSFATWPRKLQVEVLLPLAAWWVVRCNTIILRPKLLHQSFVTPGSTDNRSRTWFGIAEKKRKLVIIELTKQRSF